MTALIVDDEPMARKVLREELEAGGVTIAGEADNGSSALAQILNLKPDVVFLDLQMPEYSGIEVARRIRQGVHLPIIIFVTAYDQYAIQALDAGALDYLLKPIRPDRLREAVERARRFLGSPGKVAEKLVQVQEAQVEPASLRPRKIVGRDGEEYVLLSADEILAFQCEGETVWIVTAKRRYAATQTLRSIEDRLAQTNFRRIHRNSLVNLDHVRKMTAITSQRWMLTLTNGTEIVVSKRLANSVREILSW